MLIFTNISCGESDCLYLQMSKMSLQSCLNMLTKWKGIVITDHYIWIVNYRYMQIKYFVFFDNWLKTQWNESV